MAVKRLTDKELENIIKHNEGRSYNHIHHEVQMQLRDYIENRRVKSSLSMREYAEQYQQRWNHEERADRCQCGNPGARPPCSWCTRSVDEVYGDPEYLEELESFTTQTKEQNMNLNRKNFAEFFRTDFNLVSGKFVESLEVSNGRATAPKDYTYKIPKDVVVEVGDRFLICVDKDPLTADGLKTIVITGINVEPELDPNCMKYKWVVSRLDDAVKGYLENIEKDVKLNRAVTKLEQQLERVSLRKQLQLAMEDLDEESKEELKALFGTDVLGPAALSADNNDSAQA